MSAKKTAAKATAKKTAAKKTAKKAAATKPAIAEGKSAAKKVVSAKKKSIDAKPTNVPSIEAIARQAYLHYLHRVQNGLPGDSHGDWIAAEKELIKG